MDTTNIIQEPTREVFELVVLLRSGQTFSVDVTTLELSRNPITGELIRINWVTPTDTEHKHYRNLKYLPLDSIAALYLV